jgi:hypothetical protein
MTFTIKLRPKNDGVMLASAALDFPMWCSGVDQAVRYAQHRAGVKRATIEVYDEAGAMIKMIVHDAPDSEGKDTRGKVK